MIGLTFSIRERSLVQFILREIGSLMFLKALRLLRQEQCLVNLCKVNQFNNKCISSHHHSSNSVLTKLCKCLEEQCKANLHQWVCTLPSNNQAMVSPKLTVNLKCSPKLMVNLKCNHKDTVNHLCSSPKVTVSHLCNSPKVTDSNPCSHRAMVSNPCNQVCSNHHNMVSHPCNQVCSNNSTHHPRVNTLPRVSNLLRVNTLLRVNNLLRVNTLLKATNELSNILYFSDSLSFNSFPFIFK